jgi:hypothetical protein
MPVDELIGEVRPVNQKAGAKAKKMDTNKAKMALQIQESIATPFGTGKSDLP